MPDTNEKERRNPIYLVPVHETQMLIKVAEV